MVVVVGGGWVRPDLEKYIVSGFERKVVVGGEKGREFIKRIGG